MTPAPAEPAPAGTPRADRLRAGFWQRYAAWSLDAAVLAPLAWWLSRERMSASLPRWRAAGDALAATFERSLQRMLDGATATEAALRLYADPALSEAARLLHLALLATLWRPVAAFALLACVWHVGFERTRWRGSPGKRALRVQVADAAGGRPSPARSLGRFVAGTASWLTLNVGHAMAAIPPSHLALHDRLSGTRVVAPARKLPPWARAWLWLQVVALVAASAWALRAFEAALQATFERGFY